MNGGTVNPMSQPDFIRARRSVIDFTASFSDNPLPSRAQQVIGFLRQVATKA